MERAFNDSAPRPVSSSNKSITAVTTVGSLLLSDTKKSLVGCVTKNQRSCTYAQFFFGWPHPMQNVYMIPNVGRRVISRNSVSARCQISGDESQYGKKAKSDAILLLVVVVIDFPDWFRVTIMEGFG